MADQTQVAEALVALLVEAVYPNGPGAAPADGLHAKLYAGWPDPATLKRDLAGSDKAGHVSHITAFPAPQGKSTTRRGGGWEQASAPAPTLTATVAGTAITLGGTVSLPQAVALVVDGQDFAYAVQAADTLASIASALATLVAVKRPATAAGAVLTIPNAQKIAARIVSTGTSAKEVAREERVFTVSVWAACHSERDTFARLVEPVLADLSRIQLPDDSTATSRYVGSTQVDSEQKQGIYRRDVHIAIEYALILKRTATTVGIVQTHLATEVNGVAATLKITNQ
jgi:hypothetical protein